jgi:hypothetical protein
VRLDWPDVGKRTGKSASEMPFFWYSPASLRMFPRVLGWPQPKQSSSTFTSPKYRSLELSSSKRIRIRTSSNLASSDTQENDRICV